MNASRYLTVIADHLLPADRSAEFARLLLVLLRELAKGRPVSRTMLARSLDWSDERVVAVLEQSTNAECDDDGNVVGYGLTLRETAHVMEFGGRRLYAWCALDTLIFPTLLGRVARVSGHCAATGQPISLTVAPHEIRNVAPTCSAVSLVHPNPTMDIRRSFCCHVQFFASARIANEWIATQPRAEVVSVHQAFCLGRALGQYLAQRGSVTNDRIR